MKRDQDFLYATLRLAFALKFIRLNLRNDEAIGNKGQNGIMLDGEGRTQKRWNSLLAKMFSSSLRISSKYLLF